MDTAYWLALQRLKQQVTLASTWYIKKEIESFGPIFFLKLLREDSNLIFKIDK